MKNLIFLLIPLLFLSSCTIDWNDEKDAKIASLNTKIEELNKKLDEQKEEIKKVKEDEIFKKNKECYTYKDKIEKYSNFKNLESIFYSPIRKSCITIIEYTDENDVVGSFKIVSDIFTNTDLFRDTDKIFNKAISFDDEIIYLKWEENFIKSTKDLEKKKVEIHEKAKIYFWTFIKDKLWAHPTKDKLNNYFLSDEFKNNKEFQEWLENLKKEAIEIGWLDKNIFRELFNK